MTALLTVKNLRITTADGRDIVKGASFEVAPGEVLALIGESGSGKTSIALGLMGYARPGTRVASGNVRLGETEILSLDRDGLAALHGRTVAYVPQSAAASLNPSRNIMDQVTESALVHALMSRTEAECKAIELFRQLGLPSPETVGRRYPHQVSGGQQQRLLAAMALLTSPRLIIFDEPTTALDVTTQIQVLRAFKKVVRDHGVTAIYVSHDLAVVAQMADRILVLRNGEQQEIGETGRLISTPSSAYTRSLMSAAEPASRLCGSETAPAWQEPLLKVEALTAGYGGHDAHGQPRIPVLKNVSFEIPVGSTFGVIGESGCGKSTLARVVAGLLPASSGSVMLAGQVLDPALGQRSRDGLRQIQIVFQMADTALNPVRSIGDIIGRPVTFYHGLRGEQRRRRIRELLDMVRLPTALIERLPGDLSGGQKQRVNLARALAAEPRLILCDEVTSALDSVVGAAVLDLLAELQRETDVSYMFISHDLKTVRAICDRMMILYAGELMEIGGQQALQTRPFHPYSELLISSVPELRTGWLDGLTPNRAAQVAMETGAFPRDGGCSFFPRCEARIPGRCDVEAVPMRSLSKGTQIRCHHDEVELLAMARF